MGEEELLIWLNRWRATASDFRRQKKQVPHWCKKAIWAAKGELKRLGVAYRSRLL